MSAEGTAESRYAQPLMFSTIFSFTRCLGGGGVSAHVSLGGRWLGGWAWRWHYFTAFSGGTLGQSTRGGIALASRLTRGRLRSLPSASLGFPVPTDSLTSSLSLSLSLSLLLWRCSDCEEKLVFFPAQPCCPLSSLLLSLSPSLCSVSSIKAAPLKAERQTAGGEWMQPPQPFCSPDSAGRTLNEWAEVGLSL